MIRAAKSARGGMAVALLGVVVSAAAGVYTFHAARRGHPRRLTLSAAPSRRVVWPGARARYRITIHRRGFAGRVVLRVRHLPRHAQASAPFEIAGQAAGLAPGVSKALGLALTNPNHGDLSVTSLSVSLRGVTAPNATPAQTCGLADFSVQQFSGSYPLTVPGSSTRSLSELGVPPAQWPQLTMLDRPLDQDGCQGATIALAYRGAASAS